MDIKRTVFLAMAFGGVLMALSGCAKGAGETENAAANGAAANAAGATDAASTAQAAADESVYKGFDLKKAAMSKGNNYRIKKVLDKIKRGEDVYVACIGGSVTEGECGTAAYTNGYAYQFPKLLQETFAEGKANVHSVVAGLSGTNSPTGLIRYKKDVVEKLGRSPDLLVIEFAVNDWQECTDTGAFEQLIREVLEAGDEAAVIALYAIASYGNQKWAMTPVAAHYQIQEVDMTEAKTYVGFWTQDKIHPSVLGHSIMAQSLLYMLKEIDKDAENAPLALPAEYKNTGDGRVNLKGYKPLLYGDELNNPDISAWNVGSFSESGGATQGLKVGGTEFPQNWTRSSGGKSFSFTIDCKNLLVSYKNNGGGKAEVLVDGKKVEFKTGDKTEAFIDGNAVNWNNVSTSLIFNGEKAAIHKIEIRMAEGDEDKPFTICGFGYSK